ncbi:MAG: hypothetical protein M3R36_00135 [Bacteroidota bacterium]|nr:hypothetical protein [Bacteroidota bacterium]
MDPKWSTWQCTYNLFFSYFRRQFFCRDSSRSFCTINHGTNWTQVNNGLTSPDIWALTFKGTELFAGSL